MNEFEQSLQRVNNKLQQLLSQYQSLQKEKEKLERELEKSQLKNKAQLLQLEQLQQQAEVLRLSKNDMDIEEKKALEKRLNQYIKEIDRCITLLNE
ncbi:MAG: hypothetical protein JST87_18730 [Bacteroidetes bacterium]|nr:hypothetical protein [Bacteroidota bacterium]MBS1932560.1 hypothetical protein [Bacteroidota bacterium]